MPVYRESPPLNVDPLREFDAPSEHAMNYFEAVLADLVGLDPNFQCLDSQRLVLRISHLTRWSINSGPTIMHEALQRKVRTYLDRLPEAIKTETKIPIETTLELLVRVLAAITQPTSLHAYREMMNNRLQHLLRTARSLIEGQMSNVSGMPKIIFICVGPHSEGADPVHVITTTRERYEHNTNLERWCKDNFRYRLRNTNDGDYKRFAKCSSAFYNMVVPRGWETRIDMGDITDVEEFVRRDIVRENDRRDIRSRATSVLEANHKANRVATWVMNGTTTPTGQSNERVFDHSGETALAFEISTRDFMFSSRARCFRCRGMFNYHQIPDGTHKEAEFPECWSDQEYGMFCAEVPGHFHCVAAREMNAATAGP